MGSPATDALLSASMSGDIQTVTKCINKGANINVRDISLLFVRTPLHYAAGSGYDVICDLLLQAGADVNAVDKNGRSALHYAARSGHVYICKALIQSPRASLEHTDQFGDTPLLTAASWGNTHVCEALTAAGASVSTKNQLGRSALHEASEAGHVDTCTVLIRAGASPFVMDQVCNTPLHLAAASSKGQLCTTLLDKGADVTARNKDGNTPLHTACIKGHTHICQLLLDCGADITAKNKDGNTVLHAAAGSDKPETCKVILQNGGDISSRNRIGNTPLHVAASISNSDICVLLITAGADALLRNNEGKTPRCMLPRTSGDAGKIIAQAEKKQKYDKLVQMGTEPINVVKLFLIGDPKAGKTTLQKALVKKPQWWLPGDWQSLTNDCRDYEATPGIDLRKRYVPGAGTFAFWDCAGQLEYHVTHAMFLGAQNCIYLVAYDVTKPNQSRELRRWLAFVKAGHDFAYQTKPDVVIVATHLDKMTSKADGKALAGSILRQIKSEFTNHLNIFSDVIAINSIKYGSKAMIRLRHTLECLAKRIKGSRVMPRLCEEIRRLKHTWYEARYPVISWTEFCTRVKAVNRLADDTLHRTAAVFLTDMSEIYFKKQCGNTDWVVLEPRWLSRVIIGRMFAGENFPSDIHRLDNKQLYTVSDIRELLEDVADVYNLLDLLQHLELVYHYDEKHYIIPARLPMNLDPVVWSKDTCFTEYYGRRVECRDDTDIFTPDVFPCLQVRIMKWFYDGQRAVCISRQSLKFSGNVEGLVQLTSDQRAIHICVRCRSGKEDRGGCYFKLEHVLGMVLSELEQRSPGTAINICYLSPKSLLQHDDLEDVSYYREDDIESAKQGVVVHPQTRNTELVADILCVGYDGTFLQRLGVECNSIWLLEDDVRALCRCLDVIHPLGQDYRALAEALHVSESELDYIYQMCLRRDSSPTRALLDRGQPSIGQLRAIFKHPGLVGNKDAAQVIDKMLERFGHQVNDQESRFSVVDGFKPDNISVEVLVWREDLRQRASSLRGILDPECLLSSFPLLFDVSDREEIEATQRSLGRTKAVDRLLYKVIKSHNVELYHDFYVALETQHNTTKVVEAFTEVIPNAEGSYKAYSIPPAKPSQALLDPHNNYCMWSGSKGLAYVLNNSDFSNKRRRGSGVDLGNICHVLQEIGYVLQVHTNLTAKEVVDSLTRFTSRFQGGDFCSAVVVLMSHGNTGVITGIDENVIKLRDIYSMFEGHRCPALLGKPKLFFIQACRGDSRTILVEADGDVSEMEPECPSDDEHADTTDAQAEYTFAQDLPANADMFFAYATTEGNVSLRSQVDGSWFIQGLCEVFIQWASQDSLDVLMNKVTNRVTGQRGDIRDPLTRKLKTASQTPECIKRMRKNLYFLPKYPHAKPAGSA